MTIRQGLRLIVALSVLVVSGSAAASTLADTGASLTAIASGSRPTWSSDGRWLAFIHNSSENYTVEIWDSTTGGIQQTTVSAQGMPVLFWAAAAPVLTVLSDPTSTPERLLASWDPSVGFVGWTSLSAPFAIDNIYHDGISADGRYYWGVGNDLSLPPPGGEADATYLLDRTSGAISIVDTDPNHCTQGYPAAWDPARDALYVPVHPSCTTFDASLHYWDAVDARTGARVHLQTPTNCSPVCAPIYDRPLPGASGPYVALEGSDTTASSQSPGDLLVIDNSTTGATVATVPDFDTRHLVWSTASSTPSALVAVYVGDDSSKENLVKIDLSTGTTSILASSLATSFVLNPTGTVALWLGTDQTYSYWSATTGVVAKVDAATSNRMAGAGGLFFGPYGAWTPDGTTLAFAGDGTGEPGMAFAWDSSTNTSRPLFPTGTDEGLLWSHDGAYLADATLVGQFQQTFSALKVWRKSDGTVFTVSGSSGNFLFTEADSPFWSSASDQLAFEAPLGSISVWSAPGATTPTPVGGSSPPTSSTPSGGIPLSNTPTSGIPLSGQPSGKTGVADPGPVSSKNPCGHQVGGVAHLLLAAAKCTALQTYLEAKCAVGIVLLFGGPELKAAKGANGLYKVRKFPKRAQPIVRWYNKILRYKIKKAAPPGFRTGSQIIQRIRDAKTGYDVLKLFPSLSKALSIADFKALAADAVDLLGLKPCAQAIGTAFA